MKITKVLKPKVKLSARAIVQEWELLTAADANRRLLEIAAKLNDERKYIERGR